MKLIIAVYVLISAAFAQQAAQPMQTESSVPSLTVNLSGQQQGFYLFTIANASGHAVTAFALSTVPTAIEKGPDGFACGNRCTGNFVLGDVARPIIKAGALMTQRLSVSSVNGRRVVLNAAVFDDQSYEGEESAAVQLVARQIGRQAEYDRIVSTINPVLNSGKNSEAGKTALLRMKLSKLPASLNARMVRTFKLWFPELAGCARQYAPLMKSGAASEKKQIVSSMEQFVRGNFVGNPSLAQWWQITQDQLAFAGCKGCAEQAMNPRRHGIQQNVSARCPAPPIIFTASLADDGTSDGTQEDAAAVDLGPGELALLDANSPMQESISEPEADETEAAEAEPAESEPAETEVAATQPPAPPVTRIPKRTTPPSGIPYTPAPDGRGQLLLRMKFSEDSDDIIYRAFFHDIVTLGDMAFQEEVRWIDGDQVESTSPRAGGLSKPEIATLTTAAYECNEQADEIKAKREDLLKDSLSGYPVGWMIYAPPIPGMHELKDQEASTIHQCIVRLRKNLGSSFAHLQGFVKKIYVTSPAPVATARISDDMLYGNYLRYLATLDDLAATNPRAKKEAALREHDLIQEGLGERDRALVAKTALEYNRTVVELYEIPKGEIAIWDRSVLNGNPGPPMPAIQALPAALPVGGKPGLAVQTAVMPAAAIPESQDARTKESKRKSDEAQLSLLTGIAQLQAGMSAPVYKKFDSYLHKLYADAMIRKVAGHKDEAASVRVSQSEQ